MLNKYNVLCSYSFYWEKWFYNITFSFVRVNKITIKLLINRDFIYSLFSCLQLEICVKKSLTGANTRRISWRVDCIDLTEHNDLVVTTASTHPVNTSFKELPSPVINRSIITWENCHERFPLTRYSPSLMFQSTPMRCVPSG